MVRWTLLRNISSRKRQKRAPADDSDTTTSSIASPSTMIPTPTPAAITVPHSQKILILNAPKQPYEVVDSFPVPVLHGDSEILVKTRTIGLNPIDWKAPDFNFAIPELPYISGRELAGDVCQISSASCRFKIGDRVIAISTDYRDARKAAYQQYVVSFDFNAVRLPPRISYEEGATLGVAFVAASLALGVCMGVDFSSVQDGPDLLSILKAMDPDTIPQDVRAESLNGIPEADRAKPGDWLAVWGGSATSANLTVQLARLAGIKVATIVDSAKHGLRISNHSFIRPDLLIDSHDPQRAIAILDANVGDELRFGIDTRGKESATYLMDALSKKRGGDRSLATRPPSPPATPRISTGTAPAAHLIGLTGMPKPSPSDGAVMHAVPIKLFHEVPEVGRALVTWLERLLAQGLVSPPEIIDIEEGFENVNAGLDRMRRGDISGGKLIVRLPADE